MQIEVNVNQDELTFSIKGIMKKSDGMELGEQLIKETRSKPKRLILDMAELITASFDSIPPIVSALERTRVGKNNIFAINCNPNIERTLIGCNFERVGKFE